MEWDEGQQITLGSGGRIRQIPFHGHLHSAVKRRSEQINGRNLRQKVLLTSNCFRLSSSNRLTSRASGNVETRPLDLGSEIGTRTLSSKRFQLNHLFTPDAMDCHGAFLTRYLLRRRKQCWNINTQRQFVLTVLRILNNSSDYYCVFWFSENHPLKVLSVAEICRFDMRNQQSFPNYKISFFRGL